MIAFSSLTWLRKELLKKDNKTIAWGNSNLKRMTRLTPCNGLWGFCRGTFLSVNQHDATALKQHGKQEQNTRPAGIGNWDFLMSLSMKFFGGRLRTS